MKHPIVIVCSLQTYILDIIHARIKKPAPIIALMAIISTIRMNIPSKILFIS